MKEKFKEIFAGFQTAYGQYQKGERGENGKQKGKAFIVRKQVTDNLWEDHLNGIDPALGIIPINEHNNWEGLLGENSPMYTGMTRSQDLKKFYRPNGAGYICNCKQFLKTNIFYSNAEPFEIDSVLGTDIDNLSDFRKAEYFLEHKND